MFFLQPPGGVNTVCVCVYVFSYLLVRDHGRCGGVHSGRHHVCRSLRPAGGKNKQKMFDVSLNVKCWNVQIID